MDIWIPAVSSLVGVLIGALLASCFELWRRALDGQAAARLIRFEMLANSNRVDTFLGNIAVFVELPDNAWSALGLTVSSLLSDRDLMELVVAYSGVQYANQRMQSASESKHITDADARWLKDWATLLDKRTNVVARIEDSRRLSLVLRLLLGQQNDLGIRSVGVTPR